MKTIVLGAGISGLAYLNNANKSEDIYVYEKTNQIGGLCSSFEIDGFIFDSAIHLSFTENNIVRNTFDKVDYIKHSPLSYNYYHGNYIKHPILNNLYAFDTEKKCKILESFISRPEKMVINNYSDWLLKSYGEEFKACFSDVYTKKYWTVDSSDLSITWLGKRLTTPDLHKVLLGAFEESTRIDYYAQEMRYPKIGGYQKFIDSYIKKSHIFTNKEIVSIDTIKKMVYFSDETKDNYEKLVSSIPLCDLPMLVKGTPNNIKKIAQNLLYTKISIVSIGFCRPNIPKYLWTYVYDEDIWAARINSPSMKSLYNAPTGCSSMQFEIYHRNDEKVNPNEILANVKYALKKMKICQEDDILFMDYRILPYGNVIFYNGMEKDRDSIKSYMKSQEIELIGRFGEWDYLWSDQSFLSGYYCATKHK